MKITKLSNKSKLALISLLFITLSLSGAGIAQARDWWGEAKEAGLEQIGTTAYKESGQPRDIRVIAANIIKAFLGLFGAIFVILIVIGGFKFMFASGDKEKVTSAQSYIKNGIIGLLITLAAFAIGLYVTRNINWATNTGPRTAIIQHYG
ncbi:MAG: hypothetical protein V1865_00960 [bacterium]